MLGVGHVLNLVFHCTSLFIEDTAKVRNTLGRCKYLCIVNKHVLQGAQEMPQERNIAFFRISVFCTKLVGFLSITWFCVRGTLCLGIPHRFTQMTRRGVASRFSIFARDSSSVAAGPHARVGLRFERLFYMSP